MMIHHDINTFHMMMYKVNTYIFMYWLYVCNLQLIPIFATKTKPSH
jgi:hypothetical protein